MDGLAHWSVKQLLAERANVFYRAKRLRKMQTLGEEVGDLLPALEARFAEVQAELLERGVTQPIE